MRRLHLRQVVDEQELATSESRFYAVDRDDLEAVGVGLSLAHEEDQLVIRSERGGLAEHLERRFALVALDGFAKHPGGLSLDLVRSGQLVGGNLDLDRFALADHQLDGCRTIHDRERQESHGDGSLILRGAGQGRQQASSDECNQRGTGWYHGGKPKWGKTIRFRSGSASGNRPNAACDRRSCSRRI